MTTPATAAEREQIAPAAAVVELALRACDAYGRPDLAARLTAAQQRIADPAVHIVVVGEFKQGKSSLVNALLGATVCPVDDDVATAIPTHVRHGEELTAALLFDGEPPRREPIEPAAIRSFVVEGGGGRVDARAGSPAPAPPASLTSPAPPGSPASRPASSASRPGQGTERLAGVEIRIPRKLLAGGLVLVDTPGVGGLGSAHAAASLAAISMADAVVFVTDASQEFTRTELDFLRHAKLMCETVVCVLTKTDFYPRWRTIRDLDEGHLRRAGLDVPVMAVSSALRSRAVLANDTALNTESGFPDLVRFVTDRIGGDAAGRLATEACAEVAGVCEQIETQFEAERAALADPAAARAVIDDLTSIQRRVENLRTAAAKWSQTLTDGTADLTADIDHDLRHRIRQVMQEADDALEEVDPADTWPQMDSWLETRVAHELLANYTLLKRRADDLSRQVGEHFREASGEVLGQLGVYSPTPLLSRTRTEHRIELDKMKVGKQAMVALKSAYGGILMFTMLGSLTGVALGPIGIGIGLVMGHSGLRAEKKRQVLARRAQAKNAVRRYCDEVSFVMGKDSRDTLRRIQRQLRDHYSGLAEELNRSNSLALSAANEAAKRGQAEREKRLRDLDAELNRLRQLRQRATAVVGL